MKIIKLKIFKNIICLGEISNNWPIDFFETNVSRLVNPADNHCWQNCGELIPLR